MLAQGKPTEVLQPSPTTPKEQQQPAHVMFKMDDTAATEDDDEPIVSDDDFVVCGLELNKMSTVMQYVVCIAAVLLFYTVSGVAQEALFVRFKDFDYGFFLTFVQFVINSIFSAVQLYKIRQHHVQNQRVYEFKSKAPFHMYLLLAFLTVLGMGLGNESLNYLNFPTKILLKSSKLLLVMIVGVLVNGTKYNIRDYLASFFLFFGLVLLYSANVSVSIEFDLIGFGLMAGALVADSVSSNLQERILQTYNASPNELVRTCIFCDNLQDLFHLCHWFMHACICMRLVGSILVSICILFRTPICTSHHFCTFLEKSFANRLNKIYSATAYVGVAFVHSSTKLFGILMTLTVTSTRKVLSILLSFIIFPKPLAWGHVLAVLLVFTGVFIRIYNTNKKAVDDAIRNFLSRGAPLLPTTTTTSTTVTKSF